MGDALAGDPTVLAARLYSYGRAAPKSLVTSAPRSTGAKGGGKIPLPDLPTVPGARRKMDGSFGSTDGTLSAARKHAPPGAGAPLPYNKIARIHEKRAKSAQQSVSGLSVQTEEALGSTQPAAEESDADDKRRDPFWFIRMLRTELSDHEFAYMNVADTDGTTWDPYNLKIVAFSDVNPNNHYTISEAGVTHCIRRGKDEIAEFTPLEQWEKECGLFQEVMEIPFFKRYQSWKAYYSWKRVIQSEKFSNCRSVLTRHLFILNSTFQPSLLRVRELCVELSHLKLHQIKKGSTYTLDQFVEVQEQHKIATCARLQEFFEAVRDAVQVACDNALEQFEKEESGEGGHTPRGAVQQQNLQSTRGNADGVKRSFLQQAQLRSVCKRITNYIRVVDYVVLSTLHQLLMSSLGDLHSMFREVPLGYVDKSIKAEAEEAPVAEAYGSVNAVQKVDKDSPLFQVDIYFQSPDSIEFSPTGQEFSVRIDSTISEFVNMLKMVGTLISSDRFKRYTQPVINGRQDTVELNEGFDIVGLIEWNDEYDQVVEGIKTSFDAHFVEVMEYVKVLEPHKLIYVQNGTLDMNDYAEAPLEEWKRLMDLFQEQEVQFNAIPVTATIGIFQANNTQLRKEFIPSPRRCLNDIHQTLPELAKSMNQKLLDETTHGQERLQQEPKDVAEFVDWTNFLREINSKQKEFTDRGSAIHAMYNLLSDYDVKVDGQDAASVKMTESMLSNLSNLVQQVESTLEERTTSFTDDIETSITDLRAKATELDSESKDPILFDGKTEMVDALSLLAKLDESFQHLKADSLRFAEYQEILKVPVTKYEEVEDLEITLRLKKNLWQGLHDWGEQVEEWASAPFESLNTDAMQQQVTRYAKVVAQSEKGLPPNTVVPILKEKVATFKGMVPVVVALRNEALKEHHWKQIADVIDHTIERDEAFTLGYLLELRVNEYKEEIETISTAATQESVLEQMLAKVENMWKPLEFTVNPYKDFKDIFILGSVDDVMAVLEETQVLVQTILGSRFVGPLQKKVDEWEKKLRLFSETVDEWLAVQRSWMYLCAGLFEHCLALKFRMWNDETIDIAPLTSSSHPVSAAYLVDIWTGRFLGPSQPNVRQLLHRESIFKAADIQRQLPNEYKDFDKVNKLWMDLMRKTNNDPTAIKCASTSKLKENLEKANATLDRIQKNLEDYLETKRSAFPRFFFLSNDELLEILAEARNPQAVQPHLIKCFDNIKKLDFGTQPGSIDILAMFSGEGEKVMLGKNLKARGNVETWLGLVEEHMFVSLRTLIKTGVQEYEEQDRVPWIKGHITQVVLTVASIFWAKEIETRLEEDGDRPEALMDYYETCVSNLNEAAMEVGGKLTKLERKAFVALITGDVHNRDITKSMADTKVDTINSFTWQMQLRFYWDVEQDDCFFKQVMAKMLYGYEYQGACSRLVVTPLTDRCWMTITGGLNVKLGSAPAGPAGTGKTESVKDLAKGIGVQCVVFNCSDQLDYKTMGKLFSGVVQTGCWTCLDEFNRIDIEVLSVVAQQLLTVRQAMQTAASSDSSAEQFMFEGRMISLKAESLSVFITMNPGYAGRTELPDNLKALFRPVSMMVPDYALIAEIMLYAEGFLDSRALALKMVKMYKLCSEQLSQQDHYDYGMRQVKSVLVMAGGQKRGNPELHENISLIRAMQEANMPRFLADDLPLFNGIISDLYPNLEIPAVDYGELQTAIETALVNAGLQVVDKHVTKVIELYQTFNVRFGVMTVGPTGGGKTECTRALQSAMSDLRNAGHEDPNFQLVHTYTFNPKCITMGELYGEFNELTQEWTDGIASSMIRQAVTLTGQSEDYQWVVFDGPVDALWIENMNTVLDDNMTLCLANSERIKLNRQMHMLFEVQDLAVASPATVSRCGMVYLPPENLGWEPYVTSWIQRELYPAEGKEEPVFNKELGAHVYSLFESTVAMGLQYIRSDKFELVPTVDNQLIASLCSLFISLLPKAKIDLSQEGLDISKEVVSSMYVFSFIWSMGASLIEDAWEGFDDMVREFLPSLNVSIPGSGDVHDYFVDLPTKEFKAWKEVTPGFVYDQKTPFFSMLVPTVDTVRYSFLLERSLEVNKPVLFTGASGVGKSVVIADTINRLVEEGGWASLPLSFSAQTSALRTQQTIESKLEKKKKTLLGAPPGKRFAMFIDDVNMPMLEEYGASPPVELLRQFLDFGGFYDRQKLYWKSLEGVVPVAACGPPGGGRNPLTPRYVRHHTVITMPQPSAEAMRRIFTSIISGHLQINGTQEIIAMGKPIVEATIEVFNAVLRDLKPIPAKSHYTFNLRDVSKVVQGLLMMKPTAISSKDTLAKLWCHEAMRVFCDRLIDDTDRKYFTQMLCDEVKIKLKMPWDHAMLFENEEQKLIYGDYFKVGVSREDRKYEEIVDTKKLSSVFTDYLDEYNSENKEMRLVFFWDAVEHISRLCRVLRQPRGNAMLVGVGGSGKQSLTRFAGYVSELKCFQVELTKGYGYNEFREDLKRLLFMSGCDGTPVVFLFADTQIVVEAFLEDINNILNSGEVPNLFANDEWEKINAAVRPHCRDAGMPETKDGIRQLFISRVRDNLHIVLCMSPVGSAFRVRCRMFPSLINCCTIDWYDRWPAEALYSVSKQFLSVVDFSEDQDQQSKILEGLCAMASVIHTSVTTKADTFFAQLKRRFYVTPKSFLELLSLYLSMLKEKRGIVGDNLRRLEVGIQKLKETNEMVAGMQEELNALQPELVKKSKEAEEVLIQVNKDRAIANEKKKTVAVDEAAVKAKAESVQLIADEARAELDAAMPALNNAMNALNSLSKNDIVEIKNFKTPPVLVVRVMEAVCILLGAKPDWDSAKKVLSDTQFMNRLVHYDKDNIPPKVMKQIIKYYEDAEFVPEAVERQSMAAKSLCMWVRAMKVYDEVAKVVEPKKQALADATSTLEQEQAKLKAVQDDLAAVIANVEDLQAACDRTVAEKQRLQEAAETTDKRLKRAGKLTSGLADEAVRWAETVAGLKVDYGNLVGDVFIAAAFVAYNGPFTMGYRKAIVEEWIESMNENEVPAGDKFSLVNVMGDPLAIRDWQIWGLPVDDYSTENGILATRGKRWPLAIDPQGQANKWIKNMEAKNSSKTVKGNDATILRTIENAIRLGSPVILEDVGEELDPSLEPVLQKQIFKQGGRNLIRLGDSDVDYNYQFKFYMTTKLPNPHYLPEVCIKVTIINFTVTQEGLEDQLLGLVVREERPDLEKQKQQLVVSLAADKKQLKELEDKILRFLSTSEGNILDDEVLINALSDSKITSGVILGRVQEAEVTEKEINATRLQYVPAATRGSIIYFTIADLALIGDMYQFSLEYFNALFLICLQHSEKNADLDIRLENIRTYASLAIYNNVSRGLFGEHKITFSFMLITAIMRNAGQISDAEWALFLVGAGIVDESSLPTCPPGVEKSQWVLICTIGQRVEAFRELPTLFAEDMSVWHPFLETDSPWEQPLPSPFNDTLTPFQKLLMVKVFRPEKIVEAAGGFITSQAGKAYIEQSPLDLLKVFPDASPASPLVFVLSTGADPMSTLIKFATEYGAFEKMHPISLGQGQGPIAEALIHDAQTKGNWVVLQNCHLAKSWMPKLQKIVEDLASATEVHPDFRLWLTSMPVPYFPVPVLQASVKMTFEPPVGMRANLKGTWATMSSEVFEGCQKPHEWLKLLFALTFFHAAVQERRKFGPLGFNIRYDFNNTDLEVCIQTLRMFLDEQPIIPWDALLYVSGQIHYGGRVTDDWDRRTLMCMLRGYFCPDVLVEGYMFANDSPLYYAPPDGDIHSYREYVDELPYTDTVGIFGLHANAKITFEKQESDKMLSTITAIQPSLGGGVSGSTPEETVKALAQKLLADVPTLLDRADAGEYTFVLNEKGELNSLQIVLLHEMGRFNRLLRTCSSTLTDLGKAIEGLVVMSGELDAMFQSLMKNQVPKLWEKVSYPSLKTLASWMKDLTERVAFFKHWLTIGQPACFPLPAFFFQQGFMTGILQMHARRYQIAIDTLSFSFVIRTEESGEELTEGPTDGVYIDGFFLDGARYDREKQLMADSHHKAMYDTMPVIHFVPTENYTRNNADYEAPLYKTSVRAGVLSTTGASSNFIVPVDIPTDKNPDYWVRMGVALLCALTD